MRKEIQSLTNDILNEQWLNEISQTKIESLGILNGKEIIFEFLDQNENGCAFEHLIYIISEYRIKLSSEQIVKIDIYSNKLM